jgi:NAD(P)-dependent dehydrogenase (short-subunit alcohol dehydrogenase family)
MLVIDNIVGGAYIMGVSDFDATNIQTMTGKTIIITGGNSGIGRSTAKVLATAGARVVLAVRDTSKGDTAAKEIGGEVEVRELNLADLSSVRKFAEAWTVPLDILINNAGVGDRGLKRTSDGFEMMFGTNHLGHFALTNLLLRHITERIVTVASQAERMARLDLDDPNWSRRPYQGSRAYNDSKQANLLFTSELQRRLIASGSSVRAMAAHPGFVSTNIYSTDEPRRANFWSLFNRLIAQGPDDGALPVLYAAVADLPGDSFTGPEHLMHMRGGAELIAKSRTAQDPALAQRLWTVSEELTGVYSTI